MNSMVAIIRRPSALWNVFFFRTRGRIFLSNEWNNERLFLTRSCRAEIVLITSLRLRSLKLKKKCPWWAGYILSQTGNTISKIFKIHTALIQTLVILYTRMYRQRESIWNAGARVYIASDNKECRKLSSRNKALTIALQCLSQLLVADSRKMDGWNIAAKEENGQTECIIERVYAKIARADNVAPPTSASAAEVSSRLRV